MPHDSIHWARAPLPHLFAPFKATSLIQTMDTTPIRIHDGMRDQIQSSSETIAEQKRRPGWKTDFTLAADQQRLHLPSAMAVILSRAQLAISLRVNGRQTLLRAPGDRGRNITAAASASQAGTGQEFSI